MKILVTGGLGYIGSHTVVELSAVGHDVVIVDNLINSKLDVLDTLNRIIGFRTEFYEFDVSNEDKLEEVFKVHNFDGVIHFAGLKAVGESVAQPEIYYCNNLGSTLTLGKLCLKFEVNRFVFSSSATVYGEQASPLSEGLPLMRTTNPYGETKAMIERILSDIAAAHTKFAVSILRYFNPVGAHTSGLIGENPNGLPNNLMPYITRVAKGKLSKLSVYGDDYGTVDGTGVRDYIHVVDLAKGHVKAIEQLSSGVNIFNLGTGRGTSVLELVNTFMRINKVNVPYEIVGRRPGDVAVCYADPSKAERELGWKAEFGVEEMVRDAWKFELLNCK